MSENAAKLTQNNKKCNLFEPRGQRAVIHARKPPVCTENPPLRARKEGRRRGFSQAENALIFFPKFIFDRDFICLKRFYML